MDLKTSLLELARLQDLERTLAAVDADLGRLPGRVKEIEATLKGAETGLEASKASLQEGGKRKRALEQEIEVVKTKISKYQDQLMAVKTNEQYKALNSEIATERRKIEEIEEKILHEMERADELQKAVKAGEGRLQQEKQRVVSETASIAAERKRLDEERSGLVTDRDKIAASLPGDLLNRFRRIAGGRNGVGISRVQGETCTACGVRARPQALAEARLFEKVVTCESCTRLLLVEGPPPAVAPAGEGDPNAVEA